jgi:hypothetical protein
VVGDLLHAPDFAGLIVLPSALGQTCQLKITAALFHHTINETF